MKTKKLFLGVGLLLSGAIFGFLISAKLDLFSTAQSQGVKEDRIVFPSSSLSFEGFRMEDAVINVANTTGKAVVSISAEVTKKIGGGVRRFYFRTPEGQFPFGENDPFRRFFDDFFGEIPQREYKQMGLGSGVIIDPEGIILTNQHVVNQADKITVILPDGRQFRGEIKGEDPRSDVAIIKINARNLPVATLGDSDNLKIGQWVVAIGNPYGFAMQNPEPTVTAGVISALHRTLGKSLARDKDYNDLIQTDTAINPGNSGGPLVNFKGEIVGINVAIFSTTGGYQGIGFAIPINNAKRILSRLIEGKKILHGWLGVSVQDLTDDLVGYFGLADKNGVLVVGVLKNSPAEQGGIKDSDVIKQFDNKAITNVRELLSIVAKTDVGRKVKVVVVRDKKQMSLDLVIGERPQGEDLEEQGIAESKTITWRGLAVDDLKSENAQQFNIKEKEGVLVLSVEPNSPADEAGIIPGDLILEINRQKIRNVSDYKKIISALKGDALIKAGRGFFIIKENSGK
jgi:serine protease Do